MNNMMEYGYGYGGYGPFGGASFFGGILHILLVVLIIMIIVKLVRGKHWRSDWGSHYHHRDGNHAVDILKERYAKGEINKEEFEQRKADLLK